MSDSHPAQQARFQIGQKVETLSGQDAYICGVIYYLDSQQWHYALNFGASDRRPDEIWYEESELNPIDD